MHELEVPKGFGPGAKILFQVDGINFEAIVPLGHGEGQTFQVKIPAIVPVQHFGEPSVGSFVEVPVETGVEPVTVPDTESCKKKRKPRESVCC